MSVNFIDYVKIYTKSGSGGAGSAHFRREKFVPKGGPDGGDGGRGGHVMIKGNKQLWTLLHLKYRKHVIAGNGVNGAGNLKQGADGRDAILEVPLGTVARNEDSNEIITEIIEDGQVSIHISINSESSTSVVLDFRIQDSGIGIDDDTKDMLFKAFTQADSSHSRRYDGTGLGLAIAQELVGLRGGQINVESRVGEGSTFFFSICFDKGDQIQSS